MSAPVPIVATLNYRREQAEELAKPRARVSEARTLLRRYHDELMATIEPRLAALQAEGVVIDHASSWLLGEFVAHAPADRADEAQARLAEIPELKDVTRGTLNRAQRRRRH